MSSQGPGWWQASDGRWYPPEQHPDHVPAPPTSSPAPDSPTSPDLPAPEGPPAGSPTPMAGWAPPEAAPSSSSPAGQGWAPVPPPTGSPQSAPPPSWGAAAPPGMPPGAGPAGFPPPAAPQKRSSKGPLIIVLVLVGLLVAGAIVVVAAVLFLGTAERDDTGTIVDPGALDAVDLQVGDCFIDGEATATSPDDTTQVDSVDAIPCEQSHNAEVFANIELPDGEFPGDSQVMDLADTGCYDAFEPYVGMDYESSEYDFGWLVPTADSWSGGDRTISCVLYLNDAGNSTGSAKGSGR